VWQLLRSTGARITVLSHLRRVFAHFASLTHLGNRGVFQKHT
jgi:hypothetical protein